MTSAPAAGLLTGGATPLTVEPGLRALDIGGARVEYVLLGDATSPPLVIPPRRQLLRRRLVQRRPHLCPDPPRRRRRRPRPSLRPLASLAHARSPRDRARRLHHPLRRRHDL